MDNSENDRGNSQKLANDLNLALDMGQEERQKTFGLDIGFDEENDTWELIVKYNGDIAKALERIGGLAVPLLGNYAIVTIPQNRINAMSQLVEVEYVEKPHRLYFSDTQANFASCIYYAWNPPYNLTGKDCLIAVIDSGIDWRHPDFRTAEGKTRIVKLWDQTVSSERSGKIPPKGYTIGSEYSREDIDLALAGNEQAEASLNLSRDFSGHGTFVAGIAAGNGRASSGVNRGVAYESELLIVKLGDSLDGQFPRTTRLMEAVNYVITEAIRLEKPVAVNLSFGNNQGSHDGSDLLSTYLNAAADVWKNVIVCGSGNEAGNGLHTSGRIAGDRREVVEFIVGEYEPSFNLQLWKNYVDSVRIELFTPDGRRIGPFRERESQVYDTGATRIYVYYGEPTPYSRYQQIYFEFVPQGDYISPGVWSIVLTPVRIIDGRYNMWLPESGAINENTRFLMPDENTTLTVPSAADKVITVGAYDSRLRVYAEFSGRGYTRVDDNIKPDIVAPGVNITSASVNGGYSVRTGTSMAAPFVTGSAALMMQWGIVQRNDPYFYGEKIKAAFIRSARQLPGEPVPSKKTGWGALCLEGVFNKI